MINIPKSISIGAITGIEKIRAQSGVFFRGKLKVPSLNINYFVLLGGIAREILIHPALKWLHTHSPDRLFLSI